MEEDWVVKFLCVPMWFSVGKWESNMSNMPSIQLIMWQLIEIDQLNEISSLAVKFGLSNKHRNLWHPFNTNDATKDK